MYARKRAGDMQEKRHRKGKTDHWKIREDYRGKNRFLVLERWWRVGASGCESLWFARTEVEVKRWLSC